jgi:hypothetical protein
LRDNFGGKFGGIFWRKVWRDFLELEGGAKGVGQATFVVVYAGLSC